SVVEAAQSRRFSDLRVVNSPKGPSVSFPAVSNGKAGTVNIPITGTDSVHFDGMNRRPALLPHAHQRDDIPTYRATDRSYPIITKTVVGSEKGEITLEKGGHSLTLTANMIPGRPPTFDPMNGGPRLVAMR